MTSSLNYNQRDWYSNFRIVIEANKSYKISKLGKYISVLTNTGDDPVLSINGQHGGKIPAGISVELPTSEEFDKLELFNNSNEAISMQVVISNGVIIDSRTVLSGVLDVNIQNDLELAGVNINSNRLEVLDYWSQYYGSQHSTIMRGDNTTWALMQGCTNLGVANHALITGVVTQTLVTSAENTNGIYIHGASIVDGGGNGRIEYGAKTLLTTVGAGNQGLILPHPYELESGVDLRAITTSSGSTVNIFYEVR